MRGKRISRATTLLKKTYKHAPIRSIYRYHGREKMSGTEPSFRINSLEIHNYRGIKDLNLDFFHPRMAYDPDIMVIGSKNGLGKTSILECCAILMLLMVEENGDVCLRETENPFFHQYTRPPDPWWQ